MNESRFLKITSVIACVVVTILCLLTMNRTVGFIDSGEIAAAAATLGVPHPTGYPLLMILGHVATLLIPVRDILALNILGALMTGAGAGVMTLLFARFITMIPSKHRDQREAVPSLWIPLSAGFGGLLTSLTSVWWAQGTLFEAYALHALFLPLVMLTFLNYLEADRDKEKGEAWKVSRAGFLFSFTLGLAFTNHMTTIILAPAFLYVFFGQFGFSAGTFRRLIQLLPGFIIGLLPYLYLPIRAAASPPFNWGGTTTLSRFLDHITGQQFREFMFDFSVTGDQLGWYFATLPGEFAYIGLALGLLGIVMLFRGSVRLGMFTSLLFLFCLFYSGTYAIKEIEPYFMTATLVLGIWAAFGLLEVMRRFGQNLAIGIGALALLASGLLHYGQVDQSDNTMVEDLALNVLAPLPDNAVLFTTRWDIFLAATMYFQHVEDIRPNVSVINVNMLHDRVYLSQVIEANPEFKRVTKPIRAFVNERKHVDRGERRSKKDSIEYGRLFYRMLNGIINTNGRPTFVTGEIDPLVGYGWNKVPVNLSYAVIPDTGYIRVHEVDYRFSLPGNRTDPDVMSAVEFYALAELARAEYEAKYGKTEAAEKYIERAGGYDPGVDPDDIPILPMGNQRYVRKKARFFQSLQ